MPDAPAIAVEARAVPPSPRATRLLLGACFFLSGGAGLVYEVLWSRHLHALFGSTTKRSLAGAGQFFMMGLFGLILCSIVGIFWHNDALQFLISVVGVIVFTGLTAWDAQRLKQMALELPDGQAGSYAVVGALSLYLDFVNLFLMLLRFTGRRN